MRSSHHPMAVYVLLLVSTLQMAAVDAVDSLAWKTAETNAAALKHVIAAASSMTDGWGESAEKQVSYQAFTVKKLVDAQSNAAIPLMEHVSSAEVNRAIMKYFTPVEQPGMTSISVKQEIDWIAVMLGSEGRSLLSKVSCISEGLEDGKRQTVTTSFLTKWLFDGDNKVYMATDFFPEPPSTVPTTKPVGESLAAPATAPSAASAFCVGALVSGAFVTSMFMVVLWKLKMMNRGDMGRSLILN